jgi:WXXGXW repeat (2 copies)
MKKIAAVLLVGLLIMAPSRSFARVFVSVGVAPPPLVVYDQPLVPGPGYLWMPGYWSYDDFGWYWVAGAWVLPPEPELLWTPGYWEWDDYGSVYLWHAGYWGRHVGFYGGIAYGYGYPGVGYYGGYWEHGAFWYNSSYCHVDRVIIHNTYSKTVIVNKTVVNTVSVNGGPGRAKLAPTQAELAGAKDHHFAATADQMKHQNLAMASKETHFSVNHGKPAVAATEKPGAFAAKGAVAAKGPAAPGTLDAKTTRTVSPPALSMPAPNPSRTAAITSEAPGTHGKPAAISSEKPIDLPAKRAALATGPVAPAIPVVKTFGTGNRPDSAATAPNISHIASTSSEGLSNQGKPAAIGTEKSGEFPAKAAIGAKGPTAPGAFDAKTASPGGRPDFAAAAPNASQIVAHGEGINPRSIGSGDPRMVGAERFGARPDPRLYNPNARVGLPGRPPQGAPNGLPVQGRGQYAARNMPRRQPPSQQRYSQRQY